jgi:hypothetical protein
MVQSLPPPRPVLWPLRPVDSADTKFEVLTDGRRRITIRHAELEGVTPAMLAWWFHNVEGTMDYAGARIERYLVWHPLDHIFYRVSGRVDGKVASGSRIHLREAFQRDAGKVLDLVVEIERIDEAAATIRRRVAGATVLRLVNRFEASARGAIYTTEMTIGVASWWGRLGVNAVLRKRILGGDMAPAWVRHHVEEIGNLPNFLPGLYAVEVGAAVEHAV